MPCPQGSRSGGLRLAPACTAGAASRPSSRACSRGRGRLAGHEGGRTHKTKHQQFQWREQAEHKGHVHTQASQPTAREAGKARRRAPGPGEQHGGSPVQVMLCRDAISCRYICSQAKGGEGCEASHKYWQQGISHVRGCTQGSAGLQEARASPAWRRHASQLYPDDASVTRQAACPPMTTAGST